MGFLIIFGIIITGVLILNIPDDLVEPVEPDDIPDNIPDEPTPEPEPIFYIGIDDSYTNGRSSYIFGNETYLKITEGWNDITFIRFNLIDKPKNYSKVEISLYIYSAYENCPFGDIAIWIKLFESNWTEEMTSTELYEMNYLNTDTYWDWSITLGYSGYIKYKIGIQKIDITNYIKNNETISLSIEGGYDRGGWESFIGIHSKEANVNKSYLPQLIWS